MGLEAATLALIFKSITAVAAVTAATATGVSASRSNVAGKASKSQAEQKARVAQQDRNTQAAELAGQKKIDEKLLRKPGRLALIATSQQGVLGAAPVGRRKILGN